MNTKFEIRQGTDNIMYLLTNIEGIVFGNVLLDIHDIKDIIEFHHRSRWEVNNEANSVILLMSILYEFNSYSDFKHRYPEVFI